MEVKRRKIYSIKRYTNALKRSLDTSANNLNNSIGVLIQNPASYQFKHLQLNSKSLNSKNLSKKSSLSHLVSAHSVTPEFNSHDFFKVLKVSKPKLEERCRGPYKVKIKRKGFLSSQNIMLPKKGVNKPKSSSPVTTKDNSTQNYDKLKCIRVNISQPRSEITPWQQ